MYVFVFALMVHSGIMSFLVRSKQLELLRTVRLLSVINFSVLVARFWANYSVLTIGDHLVLPGLVFSIIIYIVLFWMMKDTGRKRISVHRDSMDLGVINSKQLFLNPNLTLEDVATELGVRSEIITSRVKRDGYTSFKDYINHLRVTHASELYRQSPKLMDELAKASGFSNRQTFFRSIKKHTGLSPTHYFNSLDG